MDPRVAYLGGRGRTGVWVRPLFHLQVKCSGQTPPKSICVERSRDTSVTDLTSLDFARDNRKIINLRRSRRWHRPGERLWINPLLIPFHTPMEVRPCRPPGRPNSAKQLALPDNIALLHINA